MSLLVVTEAVAVKMMEGTSLAVKDFNYPRLSYQTLNGRDACFEFDPIDLCNEPRQQLSRPKTSDNVHWKEASAIFPHLAFFQAKQTNM